MLFASLLVAGASTLPKTTLGTWLRPSAWALAAIVALCACIQRVQLVGACPLCSTHTSAEILRVFGVPYAATNRVDPSVVALMANDLGRSCDHLGLQLEVESVQWGGLLRTLNEQHVSWLTADHTWYDGQVSRCIRKIGKQNPGMGDDFYRDVIVGNDFSLMDHLLEQCGCDATF